MKRKHAGRLTERGSAAVELALLLPLLATMIFGAIDFGRMLWFQEVLVNSTRESARRAILFNNAFGQGDIQNIIDASLTAGGVPTGGLNVQVNGLGAAPGNPVTVQATIPWTFFVIDNLVPGINATQLTASVTMLHE